MSSSWNLVRWMLCLPSSSVKTHKRQQRTQKVRTTLSWGSASFQDGMRQGLMVFEDPVLLREMAKNAAKWARENGLARENPIHGKEEFKIVVRDSFRFSQRQRTTTRATATTTLQARCNHESLHLCQNAGGIFETAANENTANNLLMSRPQMGLTSLFFVFIFRQISEAGASLNWNAACCGCWRWEEEGSIPDPSAGPKPNRFVRA